MPSCTPAGWPLPNDPTALLDALVERGQPSYKIFMADASFSGEVSSVVRMLEAARDLGIVTLFHCEDWTLIEAATRRLTAVGRTSFEYYPESRPVLAEVSATQLAVAFCESTGAPLYVVHLSAERALDACRSARQAGLPLYVETRPLYLHLTRDVHTGPDGPLYVGMPPLRSRDDVEALWAGILDGAIDVLATDHAPWTAAQKLDPGLSINRIRAGMSNLQFMLPMFFSEGVVKRWLSLERFVATTSTNAARIFGLYPRKGAIGEGCDADLVVWDPRRTQAVLSANDFSRADYSVYEGWEVTGWPVVTIRRGRIVYRDDTVGGASGTGELLRRDPWRA